MPKKRQRRRRTTTTRPNRRRRRRTQKGGNAPMTAAKIAEKVVRKLIPSTDHVFKSYWDGSMAETEGSCRKSSGHGPKKARKFIWSRDPMANTITSMWNLEEGEYKKRDRTFPHNDQWIEWCVTCQYARRQFDAISTRRILPRWQRGDVGNGPRRSARA